MDAVSDGGDSSCACLIRNLAKVFSTVKVPANA
jgi:hypothetical protein